MITFDEIYRAITGSWQVFLDRPGADQYFDTSYAGFWRSFRAIIVIAPLYALTLLPSYRFLPQRAPEVDIAPFDFFWLKMATLAVEWVALPIVLAVFAGVLGFSRTYTSFIVVRNWATVLVVVPWAVIAALEIAFGSLGNFFQPVALLILAAVIRLMFLIARRVLQVDFVMAAGIVVLDFSLSLFIGGGINLLVGLPPVV